MSPILCLDIKQSASVALDAVIGSLCLPGYADTVFVYNFPAEDFDKFVKKITAELGFVV
jgi:hypothetical protein